ncbi:MAG: hypothetical protein H6657_21470 [Ardenticatenaceae bacterium]|nr:hypothetical protein [Ardenticatenaceae bacterium]
MAGLVGGGGNGDERRRFVGLAGGENGRSQHHNLDKFRVDDFEVHDFATVEHRKRLCHLSVALAMRLSDSFSTSSFHSSARPKLK